MPEFIDSTVKVTVTVELVTRSSAGQGGWSVTLSEPPVPFNTGDDPTGATVDLVIRAAAERAVTQHPSVPKFIPGRSP